MDSKLSLSLFGSFMMLDPAGSTLNVSTRKAKGLVAYLALRPRFSDSRPGWPLCYGEIKAKSRHEATCVRR